MAPTGRPPGRLRQHRRRLLLETTELLALDGLCEAGLSLQGAGDRRLRRQIEDPELRPITSALVAERRTLSELEQRQHFCLEEGRR